MKKLFLLISLIFAHQAMAVCSSPITRTNFSANQVLTSTRLNTELNTVYTRANELAGDCITSESVTTTQIDDGTIANADISASAAIAVSKTNYSVAILKEVYSAGSAPSASGVATWTTRVLNNETDPDSIVTLTSNEFTLQSGTYLIMASDASASAQHKTRIRNITDGTTAIIGTSASGDPEITESLINGIVTIASAKVFALQHWNSASAGYGVASNASEDEVFATVKITRIK